MESSAGTIIIDLLMVYAMIMYLRMCTDLLFLVVSSALNNWPLSKVINLLAIRNGVLIAVKLLSFTARGMKQKLFANTGLCRYEFIVKGLEAAMI